MPHAQAALSDATAARIAAEGRLPEIDALASQLARAHEEMADLQFASNEREAAAALREREGAEREAALAAQLQVWAGFVVLALDGST